MDYSSTFAISAAGMALERARVEVAALNLANAHSTPAPGQPAYRPLRVVATPAFSGLMGAAPATSARPDFRLEPAAVIPRLVHEPGHPLADARGFVSYPGVDPAGEMVSLLAASRAYEANLAALATARHLALKSLEIGSGS